LISDIEPNNASPLVILSTVEDLLWYPDNSVTHHVTEDPTIYSTKKPYKGTETIKIGNGSGLSIVNIKSTIFHSSLTYKPLILSNLLHVPLITKNLLSVSKLARDICVYFQFHANQCCVVDKATKKVLLREIFKDGLYTFPTMQTPLMSSVFHASFVTTKPTDNVWHECFGQYHYGTLKQILQNCNMLGKNQQLPFGSSVTIYSCPLELVFVDVWGPAHIPVLNTTSLFLMLTKNIH